MPALLVGNKKQLHMAQMGKSSSWLTPQPPLSPPFPAPTPYFSLAWSLTGVRLHRRCIREYMYCIIYNIVFLSAMLKVICCVGIHVTPVIPYTMAGYQTQAKTTTNNNCLPWVAATFLFSFHMYFLFLCDNNNAHWNVLVKSEIIPASLNSSLSRKQGNATIFRRRKCGNILDRP